MSIKTEIAKYGSGVGYIYLTDVNDVIVRVYGNDASGREEAEREMLVSSVLTSDISATSLVQVTAAGGDITNLSYDGVSVFDVTTPVTGATTDDLATNLATAINAHLSTPEYTAVASGSYVTVYLDPDQGSSLNGTVAAFTTTGTATMTATDLDGGSYSSEEVDSQIGYKMYLNTSSSAPVASIVGATDVTSAVIRKSAASPYSIREVEISSGSISIDRDGSVTVVSVQTEGAVAADDLTSIDAGIFADGDTIIIIGREASKVTTVKEGGNIELANNADFLTGAKEYAIILQYSISDNTWYEINRSPGNDLSVASLRSAGIAQPVEGVEISPITLTGATTVVTAGTDKGYWVLSGTGTLTGNVTYSLAAGTVEGDTVIFRFTGGIDLNGNNLQLGNVGLTSLQATNGAEVKNVWDGSSWIPTILPYDRDYALNSDLLAKEDGLGNPAANGDLLSSTTAGVRSWVSNNFAKTLGVNTTTFNSTGGGLETAYTYTINAGDLLPGESIDVEVSGYFAATANAKTLAIKFGATTILTNAVLTSPNNVLFNAKVKLFNISDTDMRSDGVLNLNGNNPELEYDAVGGLDFSLNNYDIDVDVNTTVASDISIRSVRVIKHSA